MEENAKSHTSSESLYEKIDEIRRTVESNLRYTQIIHEFTPKDGKERQKEFLEILKQNLEYTKASYALLEKIWRWVIWQRVFFILKILIILVPVIFGIIYLPPLIETVFKPLVSLLQNLQNLQE